MSEPEIAVAVDVRRPALDVWTALADPRRVATWSPEAHGVSSDLPSGPRQVGDRFAGSNRNGVFRWSTSCRVVESTPGEAFAFDVTFLGMAVARWRYAVEESDGVTRVQEQWWDHRGPVMVAIGAVGTGVRDRRTHNESTMRATLEALRAELEES